MSSPSDLTFADRLDRLQEVVQQQAGDAFCLRTELPADRAFSQRAYAVTRESELALVDWPAETKSAFVEQQFEAQYRHYRQHYPEALFLLVCHHDQPIGRLYLSQGGTELRLMDIIVLPDWRGKGLGRTLLAAVLNWGIEDALMISLHVEADNPIRHWYRRLGFQEVELRGIYWLMRLEVDALPAAQLKLI